MPLSEFLRMARGKLESSQSRPEDDLVELVWENGQIMMQGQSIRASRIPAVKARDVGVVNAATAKIGKFGVAESVLNDMSPVVPSGDLDFGHDDEMVPWLSYPMDDALAQDYGSPLLPEISGLTANGMSAQSSCEQNTITASSSKSHLLWQPQHHPTSDFVGSGVSDIVKNAAISGNSAQGRDTVNNYTSMKIQSVGQTSNSSNFLNFSNFSRPASLVKHYFSNSDEVPTPASLGMQRMLVNEKGSSAASGSNPVKSNLVEQFGSARKDSDFNVSRQPVFKEAKDPCPPERTENLCRDTSINNDKPLIRSNTANSVKIVPSGERTVEPMVASSSVGSGNSADRVSCEQTHNSKRKFRDTEESECRSDDIETESLGNKKPNLARGGIGSKRSRAAEVHNLSERRRRDKINEKMRALQELIPNCNKADKASMLDEAIEYLKTLQLQVQIMSMGAGLCMPQMMFPMGMHRMHPSHVPHFPPMGVGMGMGMGMGMGFGMEMQDINGGSSGYPIYPVPPMQLGHFPHPMSGPTNFHRMPTNFPVYGHPGQGLADSVPRAPLVPSAMGLNSLSNGVPNEAPSTSPVVISKDVNSPLMCNAEAGSSANHKSSEMQPTNVVLDQSAGGGENKQATDSRTPTPPLTSTSATDISKEPGDHSYD